jgi:RimJ/RimL family protein N-acetyltransferase
VFAIRLRPDDDLIGVVGVHPEPKHDRAWLGYWIGRPYWNRGYATEASRRAVKWSFEEQDIVEIERLYAESFARNGASCRVLEKVGMKEEGHLRRHFRKWGEYVDVKVYGLLREEWERTART